MPITDHEQTLRALLDLTQQLTDDRPLEHFLQAVTDTAHTLLGANHASLRLLDAARTSLLSGARTGEGAGNRPMVFRRGEGLIGWVVDKGEAARVGDVKRDSRWVTQKTSSFTVSSLMAEPLWSSGEVIGVLAVTSAKKDAFHESDQVLLRLLANCSVPPIDRARLKRLAMFDDLTGCFHHRYLLPRITEEMERAARTSGELSLLLMDLDHFKGVNDAHGHQAGDVALKLFVERVRATVRRVDVLVRRGGEEFVLLMPQTGATQALSTAKRIRDSLSKEPLEISKTVHLKQTVSIGVATWENRESPEALEGRADKAMYEAKKLGRDRVVVATQA